MSRDSVARILRLGQAQHVKDDLVDGLVVEESFDGRVVDDYGEEQLGVVAQPLAVEQLVRAGRRVAAAPDHGLQERVDGRVGPPEGAQRRLVHQKRQQLAHLRKSPTSHLTNEDTMR